MQKRTAMLIVVLLSISTVVALAQGPGYGRHSPMYDPKTEVTLSGTVDNVLQPNCMGKQNGVHLLLKSESESVEVCVGPASYVQQKGFSFVKGDKLEIVGSRTKVAGKDVLIARQITKESQILTLRDAQGVPAWSRRGRPAS